jgi:hypothetical protein
MTTHSIFNTLRSFLSRISHNVNDVLSDNTSEICWILDLPSEILQMIAEHLNIRDAMSLSKTCRTFYTLINDDNFWIHRIRCQLPQPVAKLYTFDLFQEPENIQMNDIECPSGFIHDKRGAELDLTAINSATHYNDEAIKKRHAKMYASKEDFSTNVQYFQYTKPKHDVVVPFMKLIYFYLIDRKRTSVVNMGVIHRNDHYLVEQKDKDSLTGRIIHLQQVCWLEIDGRFEHDIMPGKYEVSWRMKCSTGGVRMWGETEFSVVPSHGKMLVYEISENDFRPYALEHGNNWFIMNMGQIIIYEPSIVLVGIRNWINGNWKSGISWDCIELKLVP